ncbi:GAF domain-like protein [Phialemonium atrogriseum]|uniref:GAF domain-like protein n=1 Tax=Phialemonium atrogriseum TaxID=1093897 RepID=A0AAJ0FQE2_9PEZI|nr:GAF domain-like protein [Phialemonium atrogriseum]KAK1771193.1 GAF domain-like protein [Phialemonium atrogriseum]
MVHADASSFASNVTKEEAYRQVLEQAEGLFIDQRNWFLPLLDPISNLANTASLLWHAYKSLPSPSNQVNWAGFYTLDPSTPQQLILGPFQGKVACQTIALGRGVCGTAAADRRTQLVPDVHAFPGHIACDGDTRSEIVVPVLASPGDQDGDQRLVAVLDVDCIARDGFDDVDREWLEKLAALVGRSCDW